MRWKAPLRAAMQQANAASQAAFNDAERVFSLRLACVSAPIGYLAILLGAWRVRAGLGAGLMFGGIFAVFDGYWSYWQYVENWVRFVSLLVALAILLFVSYVLLPTPRKP